MDKLFTCVMYIGFPFIGQTLAHICYFLGRYFKVGVFKKSSQEDIWLQYVRVCAEIGRQCIDRNPADRPHTLYIIERLDQMERTCGFIETDIRASSATQVSVIMAHVYSTYSQWPGILFFFFFFAER